MRILIVSNLYPPHILGGYEIRCAQVAEALQAAGHTVEVVTSDFSGITGGFPVRRRLREVRNGVVVHRCLHQDILAPRYHLRPWAFFHALEGLSDASRFQRIVSAFRPEVINWWSLLGAFKLGLPLPARWGIPDVCWVEQSWLLDQVGVGGSIVAGTWQDFWEGRWGPPGGRGLTRALSRWLERRAVRSGLETRDFRTPPRHVCFVSEYQSGLHRESGMTFPSSEVIHGGVPVQEFLAPLRTTSQAEPLRLLYAGQLTADRGLLTLVEALGTLPLPLRRQVTLRVAGEGQAPQKAYRDRIDRAIEAMQLTETVTFAGKVPWSEMPACYRAHDVLVFPSERREGLPLTIIEALLSGCAVLTTEAGGAREIAQRAGLPTFPQGDRTRLAERIGQMISDRALVAEIASRGQRVAREEFSFDTMMKRFEAILTRIAGSKPLAPPAPTAAPATT